MIIIYNCYLYQIRTTRLRQGNLYQTSSFVERAWWLTCELIQIISAVTSVVNHIISLGDRNEGNKIVRIILRSFPIKFDHFIESLEKSKYSSINLRNFNQDKYVL